jgi:glycosyltransferase involved in cell wall biosynthesis
MKVTVVIPVFNERETLAPLAEELQHYLSPYEHRIIFVDDGSTDGSTEVLRALHARNYDIDVLRFRRNYGKTAAIAAGFQKAEGDVVITIDADLQDDPKEIPRFIGKIDEGFDVVCGWKTRRQDPWTKTLPSWLYNRAVSLLFRLDLHDINCGYKALRAEIAKRLALHDDMHRLIPVLAAQLGARIAEIPVEHHARRWGASKYGAERFWRGARDTMVVFLSTRCRLFTGSRLRAIANVVLAASVLCGAAAYLTSRGIVQFLLSVGCVMGLFAGGLLLGLSRLAQCAVRRTMPLDTTPFVEEELRH